MGFFFLKTICYTFQNLKTLGFFGLKAVVFILCLKLHTRSVLSVFFVAMHGFYLLVSFIFAPQGTHLNDRVDAANKRAVKILRDQ